METNNQEEDVKQFRWTPMMDRFLIDLLVEEVKQGRKPDKKFRKDSYMRAAKAVSHQFNVLCTWEKVENHLKTTKKKFSVIKKIKDNSSGFNWDEDKKMFTCSTTVYKEYVQAHPKAAPYINKPIDMYDELCMVCGDDQATGSFSKSTDDLAHITGPSVNYNIDIDVEAEIPIPNNEGSGESPGVPHESHSRSSHSSFRRRSHGKRSHPSDDINEKIDKLADQIGEVAKAMKTNTQQEYISFLYGEVMKVEGFDEIMLEEAFDFLNENEKLARSFLAKGENGRKRWLIKFQNEIRQNEASASLN